MFCWCVVCGSFIAQDIYICNNWQRNQLVTVVNTSIRYLYQLVYKLTANKCIELVALNLKFRVFAVFLGCQIALFDSTGKVRSVYLHLHVLFCIKNDCNKNCCVSPGSGRVHDGCVIRWHYAICIWKHLATPRLQPGW